MFLASDDADGVEVPVVANGGTRTEVARQESPTEAHPPLHLRIVSADVTRAICGQCSFGQGMVGDGLAFCSCG